MVEYKFYMWLCVYIRVYALHVCFVWCVWLVWVCVIYAGVCVLPGFTISIYPWSRIPQIRDPQSWLVNLGSMIQDPRSSILDRRPRVLYTPSRILDPGFRILDHASFILAQDSGSWIQFSESWIQDAGSRMQDQKSWIQHPGYWILDKLRYSICLENTSENNQIGGTGRTAFTVFPTACKCMQLLAPCV